MDGFKETEGLSEGLGEGLPLCEGVEEGRDEGDSVEEGWEEETQIDWTKGAQMVLISVSPLTYVRHLYLRLTVFHV